MQTSPTIPWTTRSDLTSVDMGGFTESSYAVKDRIQNDFYQFGELEFFILQSLRETITIDELQQAIQSRFGYSFDGQEIVRYINRLATDNMIVAKKLGDGARLYHQSQRHLTGQRRQRVMGLLSIKFPGFFPGPFLKQIKWLGWLLFNPASIALVTLAAFATIGYAIFSFQTVIEKAPSFAELVSPNHLALMLVGFVVAKILHELGHGLACQNSGHECSEMGVMLLVFLPCLYCDVSDLWTEKSRWKRIFVSLAGVFVEIAIATACFWGWYFSLDGQLSRFLFGMMLVTSVNTLFVNGNPLMRYDGYYALSDLSGVPNLAAVSREFLSNRIESFFIRKEQFLEMDRRGWLLGTYAVASFVYRWLIMFAIGWAIWAFFDKQQLASTGKLALGLVFAISLFPMVMSFKKSLGLAAHHGLKYLNTLLFVGLVAFGLFLAAKVEFSHRVVGESEIQFADAKHLFSPANGKLVAHVADGAFAEQGELVAHIENDDLTLEKMTLKGQLADVEVRLDALELASNSSLAAGEIEFWKKRQSSFARKLKEIERRESELEIHSPIAGQVVVARRRPVEAKKSEQELSLIAGGLFEQINQDCHVTRGDNLCYVGDATTCSGFLRVNEKEIELVDVGHPVRVYLPHSARFVEGKVAKVSLESALELPNDVNSRSADELPTKFYLVEFEFESDPEVRIGSSHKTVILCQQTTLVGWLNRWWRNSMWF